jgi:hypothetical protein
MKRVKVIVSFTWQHHVPLAIFNHYEINLMFPNLGMGHNLQPIS